MMSADADGYGVAQYLTYAINDKVSAKIRGEIWRDDDGFLCRIVCRSARSGSVVRRPARDRSTDGGRRPDYLRRPSPSAYDLKPAVPKPFTGLTIRPPKFRVDHSFSGTHPFNQSEDQDLVHCGG